MPEQPEQSLENQLKMVRPRRREVEHVPLTPEEKEFLGKIMEKAVAAEKAGHLAEALGYYTDYKNELSEIKERIEIEKREEERKKQELIWTKDKLESWLKEIYGTPIGAESFEQMAENLFDLTELPKLVTKGQLKMSFKTIKEFPANMIVNGRLELEGSEIKRWIGSGLKVRDSLNLDSAKVDLLPEDMHIGHDLCITDSTLKDLPDEINIERDIWVERCSDRVIKKAKKLKKEGKIKGAVIVEFS